MEIGTYKGVNSYRMIETAKLFFPVNEIEYYGFDLFEEATNGKLEYEFSKGAPLSLSHVKLKLEKTGAKIFLFKGNTRKILPKVVKDLPIMDFVFIDGGHSIETIENDWKNVQEVMNENTVVIFDDFYNIDDVGCRKIIEKLDRHNFEVTILQPQDIFKKDWGTLKINFVKVMKKGI